MLKIYLGHMRNRIRLLKLDKRMSILIVVFLVAISIKAQRYKASNPVDGFIITNTGDTIQGTIDYLSEEKCAMSCMFKGNTENDFHQYTISDIQAYRLLNNGVFYVRRNFPVDSVKRTFFAEYLLQGSISLYHLFDGTQHYYFFEDENGEIAQIRQSENETKELTSPGEIGRAKGMKVLQASQMLKKSSQAVNDLQHKDITSSNLTTIVRQYNEMFCSSWGDCVQFQYDEKASKTVKPRLRLEAGLAYWMASNKNVKGHGTSLQPTIGVGVDLDFPRYGRKMSPQFMLHLSRLSHTYKNFFSDIYYKTVNGTRVVTNMSLYDAKQQGYNLLIQMGCLHRLTMGESKNNLLVQWALEPGYMIRLKSESENGGNGSSSFPLIGIHAGVGIEIPSGSHYLNFILGYDYLKSKDVIIDKLQGISLKVAWVR